MSACRELWGGGYAASCERGHFLEASCRPHHDQAFRCHAGASSLKLTHSVTEYPLPVAKR